MGYTVYWNQSSYNKLKQQFLDDVKTACEKYVAETGDELDVIADQDMVKVNSHTIMVVKIVLLLTLEQ